MPRRDDPLGSTRIRLEGRLERLEAAPAQYAAHAARATAAWTRADVDALSRLEAATRAAESALRHLFRDAPLPPEEASVVFQVEKARQAFLAEAWMRLTGALEAPGEARACFALLTELPRVAEDRRPLYERFEAPGFSWEGPPRLACRLSRAGLIVDERFVPAARLVEAGVRVEPGGVEGLPDRSFVDRLELPYRDQAILRAAVKLLRELEAGAAGEPVTWAVGGRESAGAWVFFTRDGAFVCADPTRWRGLPLETVARALDGAPAGRVTRHLRAADARQLSLEDVQAGLVVLAGDRVQLAAREPVLEFALSPGDAARLAGLVRR